MSDLVDYFEVTSSDPSVSLEDLPIDGSPVTFTGDSLTITFPVTSADVESGRFITITIVEIGVPNIDGVTVIYTPIADPSNPVTVVTGGDPGKIYIPNYPEVSEITLTISTLLENVETKFETEAEICFKSRGELLFFCKYTK